MGSFFNPLNLWHISVYLRNSYKAYDMISNTHISARLQEDQDTVLLQQGEKHDFLRQGHRGGNMVTWKHSGKQFQASCSAMENGYSCFRGIGDLWLTCLQIFIAAIGILGLYNYAVQKSAKHLVLTVTEPCNQSCRDSKSAEIFKITATSFITLLKYLDS